MSESVGMVAEEARLASEEMSGPWRHSGVPVRSRTKIASS